MSVTCAEKCLLELFHNHPLTQELGEQGRQLQLVRQLIDVSAQIRRNNFVTGTMSRSNCFTTQPIALINENEGVVVAAYHLGVGASGHPGYVHGGVLTTIFDECCGRAAACRFGGPKQNLPKVASSLQNDSTAEPFAPAGAVTLDLSVTFISPVPVNSVVLIKTIAKQRRKHRVIVEGFMWALQCGSNLEQLVSKAACTFVDPLKLQQKM